MVIPIDPNRRDCLKPLLEKCCYDRVLIDSILEGHFGDAVVDSIDEPQAPHWLDSRWMAMSEEM